MSAGKEVVNEKKARDLVLEALPLRLAAEGKSKKKTTTVTSQPHPVTLPSLLNPRQPSHPSKKITHFLPGNLWVKDEFKDVGSTLQGKYLGKGLDERLSEAVSVGTLSGNHQNVARLDFLSEIAVSPNIVGGTEGPEDKTVSLHQAGVG